MDRITKYAEKVASGDVICGRYHRLACERHLKNLSLENSKDFPYIWNKEKAERILDYAETLTISEGFDSKSVRLLDSQAFDLGSLFGWYKIDGFRRFRRSYECKARQNGKTFTEGIKGTYIAAFSGYKNGKLFTTATEKRQARLAWEGMRNFIQIDKDLCGDNVASAKEGIFTVKDYKSMIICNLTGCTIEALSKEAGASNGFRAIYASVDEYHEHKTDEIYRALTDGTNALPETLISVITTRGEHSNTPCFELDKYAIKILEEIATAEDFFVDIYCLDEKDDVFNPKNLIKANPYLASTKNGYENLVSQLNDAKNMGGSKLNGYLVKVCNLWANNTEEKFIVDEDWHKCATKKTLEDMRGKVCYAGLDLSSGGDLTSLSLEFPLEYGKFYLYSHSFMPKGRLESHILTDIAPYALWHRKGLITTTGGETALKNDYKFIISFLQELIQKYELKLAGIGYDPHNADMFLEDLDVFGVPLLEIKQSCKFLNDGTDDMQLIIESKELEYDEENELMSWSFSNAKIVKNSFGEKKVDKEPRARTKRIDPVDACINSHITYMKLKEIEPNIDVNAEMQKYLELMKGGKKRS